MSWSQFSKHSLSSSSKYNHCINKINNVSSASLGSNNPTGPLTLSLHLKNLFGRALHQMFTKLNQKEEKKWRLQTGDEIKRRKEGVKRAEGSRKEQSLPTSAQMQKCDTSCDVKSVRDPAETQQRCPGLAPLLAAGTSCLKQRTQQRERAENKKRPQQRQKPLARVTRCFPTTERCCVCAGVVVNTAPVKIDRKKDQHLFQQCKFASKMNTGMCNMHKLLFPTTSVRRTKRVNPTTVIRMNKSISNTTNTWCHWTDKFSLRSFSTSGNKHISALKSYFDCRFWSCDYNGSSEGAWLERGGGKKQTLAVGSRPLPWWRSRMWSVTFCQDERRALVEVFTSKASVWLRVYALLLFPLLCYKKLEKSSKKWGKWVGRSRWLLTQHQNWVGTVTVCLFSRGKIANKPVVFLYSVRACARASVRVC